MLPKCKSFSISKIGHPGLVQGGHFDILEAKFLKLGLLKTGLLDCLRKFLFGLLLNLLYFGLLEKFFNKIVNNDVFFAFLLYLK